MQLGALLIEASKWLGGAVVGAIGTRLKDRKSQLSRYINELEKVIRDLEEAGFRYWSADSAHAESGFQEAKIVGLSARIVQEIRYLNGEFRGFDFVRWEHVTLLRQALTSGAFQAAQRAAEPDRCNAIAHRAHELVAAIRNARRYWVF